MYGMSSLGPNENDGMVNVLYVAETIVTINQWFD